MAGHIGRILLFLVVFVGLHLASSYVMYNPSLSAFGQRNRASKVTAASPTGQMSLSEELLRQALTEDARELADGALDFGFKRGLAGSRIARHSQAMGLANSALAPGRKRRSTGPQ
ncbi:hypothetical protein BV898_01341 [Hypsibius exemplaris]|uniref:Transmembrane protein n=1 Tax=Hypsibius exemplaris TaxID=2072580 RepID=A0A1W0XB59_HYPEX|nr:hypothetical protein BV898_01341 [Hypsibius exemplaris]